MIEPIWKPLSVHRENSLHTICSYMAMFPPSIPRYFIEKYSKKGDLVLDPFSGRGTTVLEACLLGRTGIGNDKNPLAFVLTSAKTNVPSKTNVLERLRVLEQEFKKEEISMAGEDKNIKMIFSTYTLRQLIFLKRNLKWGFDSVDTFIAALVLGAIHGGSKGYLSLQMPNTFSMSPGYVKRYIKEHNLKKPKRDVFRVLESKLERSYSEQKVKGAAYCNDARNLENMKDNSIDLILTSPPYTRTISYGKYNWIRLWFLGKDFKEIDGLLFSSQSLEKYTSFMKEFLIECKRLVNPKGNIVIILGDVKHKEKGILNLAEIIWKQCAEPLGFVKVEEIYEDTLFSDKKVSRIWGNKRNNVFVKSDRFLVIQRS